MALDLSNLSVYTQENTDLIAEAILGTDILSHISVRSGVSVGTTTINIFNADFADADRACGWNANGDMTFDQIPVTVADRQIKQEACPSVLRDYWMAERMNPGEAGNEALPFEDVIASYYLAGIKKNIEDFIGAELISQITLANGANVPAGAAALTVANAIDQLNNIYDALDPRVQMRDDVVMVMSPANYRIAVRALVAADLIHYNFADGTADVYLPGTTCKLVKSSGFIGEDTIVAFPKAYVIFATGLEGEDNFKMFYVESDDLVKITAYYRRGLGIYSKDQLATNGL
jgi:hypothetical protein